VTGKPRPIIFIVSSDASALWSLEADLGRRFGSDTRIVGAVEPDVGLERLAAFASGGDPVALVIADERMHGLTGVEFLSRAHALHPSAKRILLVERDYTATNPIVPAMTLGQIDYHLVKPWLADHRLYLRVSEFLAAWARAASDETKMFRIAAPENSVRGYEIRDLLTRFSIPFECHVSACDEGVALLREIGHADAPHPAVVSHDDRMRSVRSSCETTAACSSTRPMANWWKRWAAGRSWAAPPTTSRASGPGRLGCPLPSTRPPKA
jgi:thioredoxin reductase (NADPH)